MIHLKNSGNGKMKTQKNVLENPEILADLAVWALIEEAKLPMKPGLVGPDNVGAHRDMNLRMMLLSAQNLRPTFLKMAYASWGMHPTIELREELGRIGREGESIMFQTTRGVNTHKGAIWSLGLLTAATAMGMGAFSAEATAIFAGKIAQIPDCASPIEFSNGRYVRQKYGISAASEEAKSGFLNLRTTGLPMLRKARLQAFEESDSRLDALLSLIAILDDTCIVHRGGIEALEFAQSGAIRVLAAGGASTIEGKDRLLELGQDFLRLNLSPGGSADLLASTLFLDAIENREL
jgi:triphosphoribosyl-dephospho-CoA synthase